MTATYTYWSISNGLRGCYMPDSICIVRVRSRRELKSALADHLGYGEGNPSDRSIASLAAAAWREWGPGRKSRAYLPMCAPYPRQSGYGLFCAPATKDEWANQEEEV